VPALDRDREQLPLLDQLRDGGGRALGADPVVVAQALRAADAVRDRRPADQLDQGVLDARDRRRQHLGGEHPLGRGIDDLELAVAPGDRDLPGHVEVVEHLAGGRPVPAPVAAIARRSVVDVTCRALPTASDLGEHVGLERRVVVSGEPLSALLPVVVHPVLHHRHSSTGMNAWTCAQYSTIRRGRRSAARRRSSTSYGPIREYSGM
jgi:hypothetical protein